MKAALRGNCMFLNIYIRKYKISKVNNLHNPFRELEKNFKPNASRRKKMIKILRKINEIENGK